MNEVRRAVLAGSTTAAFAATALIAGTAQADELITQRLREALALIDVRVLDHLIVADSDVTSLAERGIL
jgi:DNA repair protein RadC